MLPQVKLEAVCHGIDAAFGSALPVSQNFDLARAGEALLDCRRFADTVLLVDVAGTNPLQWHFPEEIGLDRMNGATGPGCLGELRDQKFARDVVIPTYFEALAADQPVVHRIATVANNVLLSYRRLTVPLYATPRADRASHLLVLAQVDFAIPQIRSREEGGFSPTLRERQCLCLAARGLGTKQMAFELGISEKTIELHLARARHRLGARTTTQAVAIALAMAMIKS